MSEPIYSRIIFVGREKELAQFTQMMQASLTDTDAKWILSIEAKGGMGKTQLLQQFAKVVQEQYQAINKRPVLVTRRPIDLYLTSHQTERGILRSIAAQLTVASGSKPFQSFFTALDRSFEVPDENVDLRAIFLACYRALAVDQVVLLFDTIECASQAVQRFFKEMLPKLHLKKQSQVKTLVVTAGRKHLTEFTDNCNHPSIATLDLEGLSQSEIRDYFETVFPEQQASLISQEFIDRITTLSQGRPILVALTIDWLNYGSLTDDLDADDSETFEKVMISRIIERIRELRYPEDQTILAMAQLKRRFDADFLIEVVGESSENASALLKSVSRFSFVKTHYSSNGQLQSCLLHDIMQKEVYNKVWQTYDPDYRLRQEWSAKAVIYYETLLKTEKNRLFRQSLQLDQLYYVLYADKDQGLNLWRNLLKQANVNEYKEALNEEVKGFKETLTKEKKEEEVKGFKETLTKEEEQELDLAWATLAYDRGQHREALKNFESILEQSPARVIQSQVRPYLVYTHAHLDNFARAIELGQQNEAWFQSELNSPKLSPRENRQLLTDSGENLNALGWTYRQKGEFEPAISYYEASLDVLKEVQAADLSLASTKTNLAYLFHSMGKNREASAHGKTALKISKRSSNLKQLGLTHNVLGIIAANSLWEQEAIRHFESALDTFSEIDYTRGLALVNIAYGRLCRQSGWYKVKPNRTNFKAAEADYAKAMSMFDQAIEQVDQRYQWLLMEVYNEKGTLLREQGQFEESIRFYQNSQAIAKILGHPIWRIDNFQDMGVAYYLQGNLEQAKAFSSQAITLAENQPSPHLIGRAQRTLANVLFKQGNYEQSLEIALLSCINILELDQYSLSNSPAIRELLREEWLTWLTEDLLEKVEDIALREKQCQYLLKRWEEPKISNRPLSEHYPGFIITLEDLLYELNT